MDNNPIATAGRETRRLERLGSGPLVCILCGYTDAVALIAVKPEWLLANGVPRTLFERHHFLGEVHDPNAKVLICRNCHAKVTEGLLRADVSMRPEPHPVLRVALMLEASAVFHEEEAAALRRAATLLRKTIKEESIQ
jgi:hypothetical protein